MKWERSRGSEKKTIEREGREWKRKQISLHAPNTGLAYIRIAVGRSTSSRLVRSQGVRDRDSVTPWGGTTGHLGDKEEPPFALFSYLFCSSFSFRAHLFTQFLSLIQQCFLSCSCFNSCNELRLFPVNIFRFGVKHLLLKSSSAITCQGLGKYLSLSEDQFLSLSNL